MYSGEYIYSSSTARWSLNSRIIDQTEQYVLSKGKWVYNPSVVITLPAIKSDPVSVPFYQAITDSVKVLKGAQYVTSYGNNDYYYGGSAFQNNFDFRPSAWKTQYSEYQKMSDSELTALMFKRLPEAFIYALRKLHADADVISGVDITYTINFSIYDGTATTAYTIVYQVVGKANFKYVEGSLKKK